MGQRGYRKVASLSTTVERRCNMLYGEVLLTEEDEEFIDSLFEEAGKPG